MKFNTLEDAASMLNAMESGHDVDSAELTVDTPEEGNAEEPKVQPEQELQPAQEQEPKAPEAQQEVETKTYSIDEIEPEKAESLQYNPNFEYKVKGETREFDPRLRAAIKSPEDEDYIRDLVTKADGIDSYKEKVTEYESKITEHEDMIAQLGQRKTDLETFYTNLISERNNGNLRGVTSSLGLSEDDILKYAVEIARERNLPAEERMRVQQQRQLEEQNQLAQAQMIQQQRQMQAQLQNTQSELQAQQVDAELKELRFAISNQHNDLANALKGNNLNLEEEVIATGRYLQSQSDKTITVADALNATVAKYAPYVKTQQAVQQPTQPPAPVKRLDAIPTVAGGATVPVSSQPKSLEDLQKIYDRLGQEATRQAF